MNEQKQYDHLGPIEKTSAEIARFIVAKLADEKNELLLPSYEKASPEEKAAFNEKSTDFAIEVFKEISMSDIPFPYATRGIEKISMLLAVLKQYINGTITQRRHEYASRCLGVKSMDTNKYTEEDATVGQVLLKLNEIREAQGNDDGDYFNVAAKPEESAATE